MHAEKHVVPLVAVPFMGEVGRMACEDLGVGWLDLCGNAHIVAPSLRIIVEGRPNRFFRHHQSFRAEELTRCSMASHASR